MASEAMEELCRVSIDMQEEAGAHQLCSLLKEAIDDKHEGLRELQALACRDHLQSLLELARARLTVGFQALRLCAYRNRETVKALFGHGCIQLCETVLVRNKDSLTLEVQAGCLSLLSAMLAFSLDTHSAVMATELPACLVEICRKHENFDVSLQPDDPAADGQNEHECSMADFATTSLRNLCHQEANYSGLLQCGAADALARMMAHERDAYRRINAVMGVSLLVGQEENHHLLQLDEHLTRELLAVLAAAVRGDAAHGYFWTAWKVCHVFARLTVNDANKRLITKARGVGVFGEVLCDAGAKPIALKYCIESLWNLAFLEEARQAIVCAPGMVERLQACRAGVAGELVREAARGCLFTLGLEEHTLTRHALRMHTAGYDAIAAAYASDHSKRDADADDASIGSSSLSTGRAGLHAQEERPSSARDQPQPGQKNHLMISYEWGSQQKALVVKEQLERRGWMTWMDVDKMAGSTLEAMALAVEGSVAVLVCVSKKYKESQACRTEAEYAFQQKKIIVPLMMEKDYRPTGWLGALIGTRLYFEMSDRRLIPDRMAALERELAPLARQGKSSKPARGKSRASLDIRQLPARGCNGSRALLTLEAADIDEGGTSPAGSQGARVHASNSFGNSKGSRGTLHRTTTPPSMSLQHEASDGSVASVRTAPGSNRSEGPTETSGAQLAAARRRGPVASARSLRHSIDVSSMSLMHNGNVSNLLQQQQVQQGPGMLRGGLPSVPAGMSGSGRPPSLPMSMSGAAIASVGPARVAGSSAYRSNGSAASRRASISISHTGSIAMHSVGTPAMQGPMTGSGGSGGGSGGAPFGDAVLAMLKAQAAAATSNGFQSIVRSGRLSLSADSASTALSQGGTGNPAHRRAAFWESLGGEQAERGSIPNHLWSDCSGGSSPFSSPRLSFTNAPLANGTTGDGMLPPSRSNSGTMLMRTSSNLAVSSADGALAGGPMPPASPPRPRSPLASMLYAHVDDSVATALQAAAPSQGQQPAWTASMAFAYGSPLERRISPPQGFGLPRGLETIVEPPDGNSLDLERASCSLDCDSSNYSSKTTSLLPAMGLQSSPLGLVSSAATSSHAPRTSASAPAVPAAPTAPLPPDRIMSLLASSLLYSSSGSTTPPSQPAAAAAAAVEPSAASSGATSATLAVASTSGALSQRGGSAEEHGGQKSASADVRSMPLEDIGDELEFTDDGWDSGMDGADGLPMQFHKHSMRQMLAEQQEAGLETSVRQHAATRALGFLTKLQPNQEYQLHKQVLLAARSSGRGVSVDAPRYSFSDLLQAHVPGCAPVVTGSAGTAKLPSLDLERGLLRLQGAHLHQPSPSLAPQANDECQLQHHLDSCESGAIALVATAAASRLLAPDSHLLEHASSKAKVGLESLDSDLNAGAALFDGVALQDADEMLKQLQRAGAPQALHMTEAQLLEAEEDVLILRQAAHANFSGRSDALFSAVSSHSAGHMDVGTLTHETPCPEGNRDAATEFGHDAFLSAMTGDDAFMECLDVQQQPQQQLGAGALRAYESYSRSSETGDQEDRESEDEESSEEEDGDSARVANSASLLVERWQNAQVVDWLHCKNLDCMIDAFRDAGITGRALSGMVRIAKGGGGSAALIQLLKTDLGVSKISPMLEFVDELHRLFD